MENLTYKVELQVAGEGEKWHGNGIAYPTAEEAKAAGYSKLCAWTMATDYRVVESTDAANYNWVDGRNVAVVANA